MRPTNPDVHLLASRSKSSTSCIDAAWRYMDLKPQDILPEMAHHCLWVMDRFRRIVGTTRYMRPEIAACDLLYNAIRTDSDFWSAERKDVK